MSRGAGHGTAAWADQFGSPIKLITNEDGYRLQWLDNSDQYVSDAWWSWADGGENRAQTYTLSEIGSGKYKLVNKAHGGSNLTLYINEVAAAGGFSHQIASNGKVGDNCKEGWDEWQFLSSSERDELLANRKATAEEAIATSHGYTITTTLKDLLEDTNVFASTNKTSSITNAALSENYSGWTFNKTSENNPGAKDGCLELYESSGKLTQTVTGLSAGIYKVTLSAYLRDGGNDACVANKENGWTMSNAYLEANGVQTMIADWASDRSSDDAPNDRAAAKALFDAGKYLNEVFVEVGDDGKLDIAIEQPGVGIAYRWFCFCNVTLTWYSDEVSDETATEILGQATELLDEPMNADTKEALSDAKDTFDNERTVPNYNALSTAIDNAQTSADAYAPIAATYNTYHEKAVENLTTAGQKAFEGSAAVTGYKDGSYANNEASTAISGIMAAYISELKSYPVVGADMTDIITNPSFEANGSTLTRETPSGWTVNINTEWWGVNEGGSAGNPPAIDGKYIFGVWDNSNEKTASISQNITLPEAGYYSLSVYMHASNNANERVGNQRVFAGDKAGYFKDQISNPGDNDAYPMQKIYVDFEIDEENAGNPISIGVTTDGAASQTWFKIDNFQLTYLGDATANLTVSEGKLGTFIAPFEITLPAGVKAYSAASYGETVTLAKIKEGGQVLDAGTPVIVYGDEVSVNRNFYGKSEKTGNQKSGALVGILDNSNKTIASGNYVLQTIGDVQAFYFLDVNAMGKLNRCYLTSGAGLSRLAISMDDDETAINVIETVDTESEGLKDGKYLENGKIVIVKNSVKYSTNGQIIK